MQTVHCFLTVRQDIKQLSAKLQRKITAVYESGLAANNICAMRKAGKINELSVSTRATFSWKVERDNYFCNQL